MESALSRNSKGLRQQSLRQLLAENQILAQDEVVGRMVELGFHVTQSSISRDFKELGVSKIDGRYVVPSGRQAFNLGQFVVSQDSAGENLYVIKAQSGWTAAVAEAIDHQAIDGVVGTIAGENTIMIATKDATAYQRIQEFLATL